MRHLKRSLIASAAALIAFVAAPAMATEYVYSYNFAPYGQGTASGSFTGTGPVTDITNISDVTLEIDGTTVTGPITAYSYTGTPGQNCGTCFTPSGATISSIPQNENFLFGNSASLASVTEDFYIIPGWTNPGPGDPNIAVQGQAPSGTFDPSNQYNGDYIPANFTVAAVPEPATWAMMLVGMGMVGFSMRRRTKVAVSYA